MKPKQTCLAVTLKNTNSTFSGRELIPFHRPDKPVTKRFLHSRVLPLLQARALLWPLVYTRVLSGTRNDKDN